MKNLPPLPRIQTLYTCPDQRVKVIRKTGGLRRYPQHSYPCVLFLLAPKDGTRVQTKPDGSIEFMAAFDELKAMLAGIDPALATVLPATIRNKPRQRQVWWQQRNRARFAQRRAA